MWCKIEDCENPIENRETGLCATHGRLARKKPKEAKTYTIPAISKKKSKALAAKNKVYAEMDANTPRVCSGCGSGAYPLSHSHIIPVSQHPEFEAEPTNIIYDCLTIGNHKGCHDIWEHGTWQEKQQLLNYQYRIEVMKILCISYLKRILQK